MLEVWIICWRNYAKHLHVCQATRKWMTSECEYRWWRQRCEWLSY